MHLVKTRGITVEMAMAVVTELATATAEVTIPFKLQISRRVTLIMLEMATRFLISTLVDEQ